MDLLELRKALDGIDEQLVDLYVKRMDLCRQVGTYKLETGKKILDSGREEEKLSKVEAMVSEGFLKKGVRELFSQLMSMSRKLQYQMLADDGSVGRLPFISVSALDTGCARIVFPGVEGSYTQAAMQQYFRDIGDEANFKTMAAETFRDAMGAIEDGMADFAVLPIENSLAGGVLEVYDLLMEYEHYIVGETKMPISHVLAGLKGARTEDIARVYSHPQGLMQCARYLDQHREWEQRSIANTAIAAKKILEDNEPSHASICSAYAARVYGLDILEENISDLRDNTTRFIVISNQKIFLKDASKISICFEVPHESGSLYHLLSHFIYNDLSMTKIESRPIEGRAFEYRFFVDFEGNMEDGAVKNALRGLREEAGMLKILGNY